MFLQLCVILLTGGCLPQCMLGYVPTKEAPTCQGDPPRGRHPPRRRPPKEGDPHRRHPPEGGTPQEGRHPQEAPPKKEAPPEGGTHPPKRRHPPKEAPPQEADLGMRSMSGRYASYWNAFLVYVMFSAVSVCPLPMNTTHDGIGQLHGPPPPRTCSH